MTTLAALRSYLVLALYRDRLRLPLIVLLTSGWLGVMARGLIGIYPDGAARAGAALTIDNPGSTFLIGRIYHAHDYNWGAMTGHETLVLLSIVSALIGLLTVVRHTRAEEESGRSELLRSTPAGRHAQLASGILVAAITVILTGVGLLITLVSLREPAINVAGAAMYSAAVTSAGLVWVGGWSDRRSVIRDRSRSERDRWRYSRWSVFAPRSR